METVFLTSVRFEKENDLLVYLATVARMLEVDDIRSDTQLLL